MERMEQIECHQEEFELEQDVDASQIYFMPAAEEQSDGDRLSESICILFLTSLILAGGQAGAASGQGVRSPAKREPQPSESRIERNFCGKTFLFALFSGPGSSPSK